MCYYTMFQSMATYLEDAGCDLAENKVCHSASSAFGLRSSFRMLAYVMPILGGYLADNVLGRYKTILWFTIIYVIGVAMMAVGAIPDLMKTSTGYYLFLIGSFVFTAVGTGAIKPNVVNFGAEQYDTTIPLEAEQQKSYFSYFYMVINMGSIFSAIWTVGLATGAVTDDSAGDGFLYSYAIAAVAMALALVFFVIGTPKYSAESKKDGVHTPMVSIIRKHLIEATKTDARAWMSITGLLLMPVYLAVTLIGSLIPSDGQPHILVFGSADGISLTSCIAFALCVISTLFLVIAHRNNDWIPEMPTIGNAISTAEVRTVFKVIPTILAINIGFNVGYNGMDIYGAAACQMDVRAPNIQWLRDALLIPNGQLNGNFFSLGNNFSIILMIPVLEMLIFPMLKRARGGEPIPRKAKYIMGFFLIIVANAVGALIEQVRRNQPYISCTTEEWGASCGSYTDPDGMNHTNVLLASCSPGGGYPMSDMSGWWTFIPYFITGCGEILVNPIVQEFAFDETAPRIRSFMMGFALISQGCVPSVITAVFAGFVPSDLNSGPIIWCYVANSVVSFLLLLAWIPIAVPDKKIGLLDADGGAEPIESQ